MTIKARETRCPGTFLNKMVNDKRETEKTTCPNVLKGVKIKAVAIIKTEL
jgi:hypothetical protein